MAGIRKEVARVEKQYVDPNSPRGKELMRQLAADLTAMVRKNQEYLHASYRR